MTHVDRFRVGYNKKYEDGFKKIVWDKKNDNNRSEVPRKNKGSDNISPVGHSK